MFANLAIVVFGALRVLSLVFASNSESVASNSESVFGSTKPSSLTESYN